MEGAIMHHEECVTADLGGYPGHSFPGAFRDVPSRSVMMPHSSASYCPLASESMTLNNLYAALLSLNPEEKPCRRRASTTVGHHVGMEPPCG